MLAIAPQEANTIVQGADGLPPLFYRNYCDTDDRLRHYMACRAVFQNLTRHLECYFTGEVDPEVPENLRIPFALWRDYYVALYGVIRQGWRQIVDVAQQDSLPIPATPGEMLVRIVADECDEFFAIAFPEAVTGNQFSSFSPQGEYRYLADTVKAGRIKQQGTLSEANQKWLKRFRKQSKERQPWFIFVARREFCLTVCRRNAKGDRLTREALKKFDHASAQWEAELVGFLHPSRRGRGFTWNKGVLNKT